MTTMADLIRTSEDELRSRERALAVLDESIAARAAELAAVRASKATDPTMRSLRLERMAAGDAVDDTRARLETLRSEAARDEALDRLAARVLPESEVDQVAAMTPRRRDRWLSEQVDLELFVMRSEALSQTGD
jgi:hypothetical protein